MHVSSGEYADDVSEFDQAGFTEAPSRVVAHPRIAEAPASFECRLYGNRYCTTRQRFELPGTLPED